MNLRRRLGNKLKHLMGNQTQEVFSKKIGVGQASLNRILKGKQDIGIDMIEQICRYTGTSVQELLGSTDSLASDEPVQVEQAPAAE